MRVKVIIAPSYKDFEEKLNEFIKDISVVDIKYQVNFVGDQDNYSGLVLYNDLATS